MVLAKHYLMKSDVREKKDAYLLEVDLPGCRKEDIRVYTMNGYLYVAASMNKEKEKAKGKFLRKESYSGAYQRSFYIGDEVNKDNIRAAYKHGVLKITLPKENQETPKSGTISIA